LVQEILIYLGGFVRAEPQLFDGTNALSKRTYAVGILRVRTHHIIVAMRDVIMEMRHCSESEAMENMMQACLGTIAAC
jgi:hypothetical protein